ncbi:hypothetical protein ACQ5SO_14325 [Rhodovulum sp. DZ06]|uniref:hypothetical protein n=1 Tax=Rhodovulum sp. DZ06 TaxID=3425126 RepID=UPI003D336D9E
MSARSWTGLALGALIAGCAAPADPDKVGLGGAIYHNVLRGGAEYEAKNEQLRAEIAMLDRQRFAMEAEADRLRAEAARLRGERRAAARRLSELNDEMARMNGRISEMSEREGAANARLAELRGEATRLSEMISQASAPGAGVSAAEIARLEARRTQLLSEVDALAGA